jgi:hypothetical protein
MGATRSNANEGSTNYLNVKYGTNENSAGFWQTAGYSPDSEFYTEESWSFGEGSNKKEGVRKGLKFDTVTGNYDSSFFKEGKFGEEMKVYLRDDDDTLWCLGFKVSENFSDYAVAKRVMTAVMVLDKSKPVSFRIMSKKDGDYTNTNVWVEQDGKTLELNPEKFEEDLDTEKRTPMPVDIQERILNEIRVKTAEERKVMSKNQQKIARIEELEDFKVLVQSVLSTDVSEAQEKPVEKKKDVVKEKPVEEKTTEESPVGDAEIPAATPKKLSAKDRLRAIKEGKK